MPPRFGGSRLIAVDGPSGAGKTSFALRLAKQLDAPVVHTDDLLDGWDDQFTFWERLEREVLGPLRRGETATYLRYQWHLGKFAGPPLTVDPAAAVLLEGVSAARREIRPELSLAVFVTAPADLRLRRAVARDGDDSVAFRAYLERWRAAENRHFAEDETAEAADLIVDGAATTDDDRFTRLHERLHQRESRRSGQDGVDS
ncbi:AAA family ATPase [Actinoplanes sp. KI2]|uniref:uridine kinase family protein n=1 Tax=Actinoplanes sp. KI2 TaxID=2983315 RepID=UPI0021D5E1D5|nr:AAA family ATPase [Actinoplanes sp. KI2]MCU7722983.1 AAA family ATPase [Actinoplanes sp. KI2]